MDAPDGYQFRDYDNAVRLRDHITSARLQLGVDEIIRGRFIAVALGDCWCNGDIYDNRDDAVRMVRRGDANQFMYIQVPIDSWSAMVCDSLLYYWRGVYKNGYRPAGTHAGTGLIIPHGSENFA